MRRFVPEPVPEPVPGYLLLPTLEKSSTSQFFNHEGYNLGVLEPIRQADAEVVGSVTGKLPFR